MPSLKTYETTTPPVGAGAIQPPGQAPEIWIPFGPCRFDRSCGGLVPTERTSGLILDNPSFEKIPFLLEIGHLAHPRKRIARTGIHRIHADLLAAAIGDVAQVLLEHRNVEPQH